MNKTRINNIEGWLIAGGGGILRGGQSETRSNLRDEIKDKEQRTNTRIKPRPSINNDSKNKEQHKPWSRSITKKNKFKQQIVLDLPSLFLLWLCLTSSMFLRYWLDLCSLLVSVGLSVWTWPVPGVCCSLVLFSVPYHCLCSVFFGFVSWACFSLFLILLFDFVFVMFPLFLCYLVWLFVLVLCSLINVVRVFGCSCYVFCCWLCYMFLVVGSCLGVLMFRLWFHSVLLLWLLLFVIC